jgi:AcrR family transcriptional regulator
MSTLIIVMTTPRKKSPAAVGKRAENKERTKRKILEAALALFRKNGFYRTTTKAISERARIAEGTLFNYFATKEDLALYFFEREVEELIHWFENESSLRDAPLVEKLFAIIHRHLDRVTPYEEFIGAVYLRALQPASKLSPISLDTQGINIRYLKFIRGILAGAEAGEEIPPVGDFGAYACGLFHLAIITYWLNDGSPGKENTLATLDRTLKVARALVLNGGWEW